MRRTRHYKNLSVPSAYARTRTRFKNMFTMPGSSINLPAPTPPPVMPDPYSAASQEARRQAAQTMMSSAGRTSTILTTAGNRGRSAGPSGDYSQKSLGK